MYFCYNDIKHVLGKFRFEGTFTNVEEMKSGNINNTYHLYYTTADGEVREYTLQQINTYVFKKPEEVMSNIYKVTDHLEKSLIANGVSPERHVIQLVSTKNGEWMYRDEENRVWRAYHFISDVKAYDKAESTEHFMEAGRTFGEFQKMLFDFPAYQLYETIPDFHNTKRRFYDFVASIAEDKAGRVKLVEKEIDFFFDRRKMMYEIVDMIEKGDLPLRVTHNDTKMNNVLLDAKTGKGLCVIDLDTVMPGSVLYDYGDAIRFGASTAAEDEPDVSEISLDLDLFKAFTKGFISQINGSLTENEMKLLPLGIKVMTCELAMRWLKDYIDGDLYFKIRSPEHNLIRARAQMKLLQDVEEKYGILCEMTEKLIAECK